jgi:hypothetical protein
MICFIDKACCGREPSAANLTRQVVAKEGCGVLLRSFMHEFVVILSWSIATVGSPASIIMVRYWVRAVSSQPPLPPTKQTPPSNLRQWTVCDWAKRRGTFSARGAWAPGLLSSCSSLLSVALLSTRERIGEGSKLSWGEAARRQEDRCLPYASSSSSS